MASEQFSLCWDNFHKNMSLGMQSLLENEDLVDVTLAVEGRYLKAHKMVLSVCSPYFRELFQTNPCKHPIVFMKDVSYIALSDLLQFMYQGEVQVAQESLPTFIKTAEALQIKGLTGDGGNQNESETQEETSETEQPTETKRMYDIETKTVPGSSRIKRLSSASASKRPKFTVSSEASANSSKTALVVTKTEISGNTNATTTSGDTLKFKMEPSESTDQSQVEEGVDDSQIDTFDESNIDDTQDDIEEYSLMETGDDEPKPGTSADGAGDSQGLFDITMHLFKIWNCKRNRKQFVCVTSYNNVYEELIFKACRKLRINGSKLCLEKDGTVIDDDEVLLLFKNETLMLLEANDVWKPEGADFDTDFTSANFYSDNYPTSSFYSVEPGDINLNNNNYNDGITVDDGSNVMLDTNKIFWQNYEVPWNKIPRDYLEMCSYGTKNKLTLTQIVHIIIHDMRKINVTIPAYAFKVVAKKMSQKYPKTFLDMDESNSSNVPTVTGGTYHKIFSKLQDRNNYLNRRPHRRNISLRTTDVPKTLVKTSES